MMTVALSSFFSGQNKLYCFYFYAKISSTQFNTLLEQWQYVFFFSWCTGNGSWTSHEPLFASKLCAASLVEWSQDGICRNLLSSLFAAGKSSWEKMYSFLHMRPEMYLGEYLSRKRMQRISNFIQRNNLAGRLANALSWLT